jgi:hypothetical protein
METLIFIPNRSSQCDGMNTSRSLRARVTILLGMLIAVGVSSAILSPFAACAQTGAPHVKEPAPSEGAAPEPTPSPATTERPTEQSRKAWQKAMKGVALPKKGCFKTAYPSKEWQEVPCTTAPNRFYLPARGFAPTPGAGNSAQVAGHIVSAGGSFDSVIVTGETDSLTNTADAYSLQLNTQPFAPTTSFPHCISSCQAFEQFIFSNYPGASLAFIQYWLEWYGNPCPSGWFSVQGFHCVRNSPAVSVPFEPIHNLGSLELGGVVFESGGALPDVEVLFLWTSGNVFYAVNGGFYFPELASSWEIAEFNIFGICCGSAANFNPDTTIVVRTVVEDATDLHGVGLSCVGTQYVAESNNLTLLPPCCVYPRVVGENTPAIVFAESDAARTSICSGGTAIASGGGNIALVTFAGLLALWSLARVWRHRRGARQ